MTRTHVAAVETPAIVHSPSSSISVVAGPAITEIELPDLLGPSVSVSSLGLEVGIFGGRWGPDYSYFPVQK